MVGRAVGEDKIFFKDYGSGIQKQLEGKVNNIHIQLYIVSKLLSVALCHLLHAHNSLEIC